MKSDDATRAAQPPDDSDTLRQGIKPEALTAWARPRRMLPLLETPVGSHRELLLGRSGPRAFDVQPPRQLTIAAALSTPLGKPMWQGGPLATERHGQILRSLIERFAAEAATAERTWERQRHWLNAPAEASPARAFDAALACAASIAAPAPPLHRNAMAVLEDPPRVVFRQAADVGCRCAPVGQGVEAEVTFRDDLGEAMTLCRSRDDGLAPCSARRGAAMAAATLLAGPADEPRSAKLLSLLSRPLWERAVRNLVQDVGAVAEGEEQLGFRIDVEAGRIVPIAVRAYLRGVGFRRRDLPVGSPEAFALPRPPSPHADALDTALELLQALSGHARGLVEARLHAELLLSLVGHPLVFLGNDTAPTPIVRGLVEVLVDRERSGRTRMSLLVDGEPAQISQVLAAMTPWGGAAALYEHNGRRLALSLARPLRNLISRLHRQGETLAAEASAALRDALPALSAQLPIRVGAALLGREVEADRTPVLRGARTEDGGVTLDFGVEPLAGRVHIVGQGAVRVLGSDDNGPVWCDRDLEAELTAARAVAASLAVEPDEDGRCVIGGGVAALALVERLSALGDSARVLWRDRPLKVSRGGLDGLRLSAQSRRGWLEVDGALIVDDVALPLRELLAAVLRGERMIEVSPGHWLRLERELRAAIGGVARIADSDGTTTKLPMIAAGLLGDVEAAGGQVEADASLKASRQRIAAAMALEPEIPVDLRATLWPYQQLGVRWLCRMAAWAPGAVLADDMGLGKTLQSIALLLHRAEVGPALVVAPTSVCAGWLRELANFAPTLRVQEHRGSARADELSALGRLDVRVVSYDLLLRDDDVLQSRPWATLVLDEAQAIKNPTTQRARAVFALDAGFRLALSGTPIENRASDVWSLCNAVLPGLLGNLGRFRERFGQPIERDNDPDAKAALAKVLSGFVLRRTKGEVLPDLPERTEVQLDVTLSEAERELYDSTRLTALQGLQRDAAVTAPQRRIQVLAALTRLRQLACHPKLVLEQTSVRSSKLTLLLERLVELREAGQKALVFSQFVRHLELVREEVLPTGLRLCWLDGSMSVTQRQAEIARFDAGEADVFLISLKAGGTGLNLTAASNVFLLDPWWNPAVEAQAGDRAHRIGQKQPVTIYRLVSRDTVEEAIVALQDDKRALAEALLEGSGAATSLGTDELLDLIAGETPRKARAPSRRTRRDNLLGDLLVSCELFLGDALDTGVVDEAELPAVRAAVAAAARWLDEFGRLDQPGVLVDDAIAAVAGTLDPELGAVAGDVLSMGIAAVLDDGRFAQATLVRGAQ